MQHVQWKVMKVFYANLQKGLHIWTCSLFREISSLTVLLLSWVLPRHALHTFDLWALAPFALVLTVSDWNETTL